MTTFLRPSKIRYSQDSICNRFCDGSFIGELVDDIYDGRTDVEDIAKISVMRRDNRWISADNRRLWVFRMLERFGLVEKISVSVTDFIPARKLTADVSTDYGRNIRVRGNPGGIRCEWRQNKSDSDDEDDDANSNDDSNNDSYDEGDDGENGDGDDDDGNSGDCDYDDDGVEDDEESIYDEDNVDDEIDYDNNDEVDDDDYYADDDDCDDINNESDDDFDDAYVYIIPNKSNDQSGSYSICWSFHRHRLCRHIMCTSL